MRLRIAGITLALGLMALVWGQAPGLRLTLLTFQVVQAQGQKEELRQALEVRPGDILEYRLEAENVSNAPQKQVSLVLPIPKETAYLEGSATVLELRGLRILPTFSYDGGKTFGLPPLKRKVKVVEGGKEVEKEVEVKPEEYTHVRWVIPELGPKEKVVLKARVIVR
ncbi:hypothetical protein CSW29_06465 [Thermus scotoductus]|uniref:DUF11 domain-containing protein n=2 Tax=Thermus scotoductus TaxID=37636 RepID=A0A430UH01_THESC|nr:hypothetical protein CSW29_06465 [Thermus scotoductus]